MTHSLRLFTARYSNPNVAGSGLIPVGITRYPPRFRLAYTLRTNLYDLAPTSEMLALSRAGSVALQDFAAEYERRLEDIGLIEVVQQLAILQAQAAGIVLLCYEDVTAGASCHRRMLAEWLTRQAGIGVPELADPGKKSSRKKSRPDRQDRDHS